MVSTQLLSEAGIDYDILGYTSSIYGNRYEQKSVTDLAKVILDKDEGQLKRLAVFDDFLDSPIIELEGDTLHVHTLAAGETPSSVFQSLVYAITYGYSRFSLGHEKSGNFPNMHWNKEAGQPINHEWGKSIEAQKLINTYINEFLVPDFAYYSPLMPLSDPAIVSFLKLSKWSIVKSTSSCNVEKPWCKRCPKCVYVWLLYLAFLDEEKVKSDIFDNEDLFLIEENKTHLKMLAGLTDHTPFECVGQPNEVKLALAICKAKDIHPRIISSYIPGMSQEQALLLVDDLMRVDENYINNANQLPETLKTELLVVSEQHFARERQRLRRLIIA